MFLTSLMSLVRDSDLWMIDEDDAAPRIVRVMAHGKAIIVFWSDGTRTVARCAAEDVHQYDARVGVLLAVLKKYMSTKEANRFFDFWDCMEEVGFAKDAEHVHDRYLLLQEYGENEYLDEMPECVSMNMLS